MALRVCETAYVVALFVVAAVAQNTVYTTLTSVPGGTVIPLNKVVDNVENVATPSYHTGRDCMISPTTTVPQTPTSATVSVQAGYLGTVGTTTVCCAYFGRINSGTGTCDHNVCDYTNLEQLAAWGYNYNHHVSATLNTGTLVPTSAGSTFFFSSTSTTSSNLCFPVTQCYEDGGKQTSEPYVHPNTYANDNGGFGHADDNFLSGQSSQPSTAVAVSPFRTAWIRFAADFSVQNNAVSYIIPGGYYSAYEITTTNPTSVCTFQQFTLNPPFVPSTTTFSLCDEQTPPRSSYTWVCKDRGISDESICTLPCGTMLTKNFILDQHSAVSGQDPYQTAINKILFCYANCICTNC